MSSRNSSRHAVNPRRSRLGPVQVDQRDPDIGSHHLAQLGGSFGHHDLQRREHPSLQEMASLASSLTPPPWPIALPLPAARPDLPRRTPVFGSASESWLYHLSEVVGRPQREHGRPAAGTSWQGTAALVPRGL